MSEESSSPIVDADLLEAAKENVQPLATGRRVTALSTILATPHAHRESKLASTRNRLRINVDIAMEDEDEDPLEAYCCLVNWTIENYPQGHSAESGLLELLEEATRVLKDHRNRKWRAEPKYLRLWLLYASYVEKPTVIYRFLIANDIGTDLSMLYEEYSAVLERDGRRQEADRVYKLGIARRADPLDHLKARHADFEKRMMCATPVTLPESASTSTSGRPATLATTVNRLSGNPLASVTATPRSNAPVQVFVDPSGAESSSMERNAWPDLGTRKTRIKENVPQTKKMAGSTLKQSKRTGSTSSTSASRIVPFMDPPQPSAPRIVPFVDEEPAVPATPKFTPFRDETVSVTSPVAHAPDSVMKVKGVDVASYAEAEALRKDPLKNYGTEGLGFDETLP